MKFKSGMAAVTVCIGWVAILFANMVSTNACACVSIADNQDQAQLEINAFKTLAQEFKNQKSELPNSLGELLVFQKEQGVLSESVVLRDLRDPWGNEYKYEKKWRLFGPSIKLTSFGNDGRSGGWFKNADISN